jgi:hypothetical protein
MEKTNTTTNCNDGLKSISQEVEILRKAYELIWENSNLFYDELAKAFRSQRERGEFDFMI